MTDQKLPRKSPLWVAVVALAAALVAVAAVFDSATSLWQRFPNNILLVGGLLFTVAAALAMVKTWRHTTHTARILLLFAACSGLVIALVGSPLGASTPQRPFTVAPSAALAKTQVPATTGTPADGRPRPQPVGCLRDDRPTACDADHDAEAVELTSCTVPALVDYMGGVAGVDQLSDSVRVQTTAHGPCVVRFGKSVRGELRDALAGGESAQFRQCYDREYRSVTCDQPHVAELTLQVVKTESLDCHSAATRYLGVTATTRENDLTWPEITGSADTRLCALSVRNPTTSCLTGTLRNLGQTGIRLSRDC